jgi:hypothetical protein
MQFSSINTEYINTESEQTKMRSGDKNMITKNYITQNIRSIGKYAVILTILGY